MAAALAWPGTALAQKFVLPEERQPAPTPVEPAGPAAPVRSAEAAPGAPQRARPKLEPVFFNGVELGASTPEEVAAAWGKPRKVAQQNSVVQHTYDLAPFERVEVTFHQNKALALVIHLRQTFTAAALTEELELKDFEPVSLRNEAGTLVGQAYPERGVGFNFQPGSQPPEVAQIVLEDLDPQVFVLRAAARLESNYSGALSDADAALELDPKSAQAHELQARVWHRTGHTGVALGAAEHALGAEPSNAAYRLTQAGILADLERLDEATGAVEKAISAGGKSPEVKARAVCLLGDLAAAGSKHDHKLALDYHMQAIKLAEPLLRDPRAAVRSAAREVLIDAHLACAVDIAAGRWKNKLTAVPKWLDRARALAADASLGPGRRDADALRLCRRTLAACAGLEGQLDPGPAVDLLLETIHQAQEAAEDPLFKSHLELELGRALMDAVQAYHLRGDPAAARQCGTMAAATLEHVWAGRTPPPADAYKLARLQFRLGAIAAIEDHDHQQAVQWYDKAVETLEQAAPESVAIDLGRRGEALVSMAVSYWAVGQQERALQLTRLGGEWMEQAVEGGSLDKRALVVPYSNLATMHRHLGEADKAREYQEMASRWDGNKVR